MLKLIGKIASKISDSNSATCRSENPPYCRYHGIPRPQTVSNVKALINVSEHDLNEAKKTFDFDKALHLNNVHNQLKLKLQAIEIVAGDKDVSKQNVTPILIQAVKERRAELKDYSEKLAKEVFSHIDEQHIALKGFPADFAWKEVQEKGYPTAYMGNDPTPEDLKADKKLDKFIAKNDFGETYKVNGNPRRLPISWDSYGRVVSFERAYFLKRDAKFMAKLNTFRESQERVKQGKPTFSLAENTM
jgi:hypothetical protein